MADEQDFYAVLGIAPNASDDAIRSAYRSAAKRDHPDRFPSYFQKLSATARMQDLNHAYSVLKNPAQRRAYDSRRPPRAVPGPAPVQAPARSAAHRPSSFVAVADRSSWWIAAWLTVSSVFGFFMWRNWGSPSGFELIYIGVVSLIAAPFLVFLAVASVALPVFAVATAFKSSFADRRTATPSGFRRLAIDFLTRAGGLAGATWLLVKAFGWGLQFDLLYLVLLTACGALAGELTAMILYVFGGLRTVRATNALVHAATGVSNAG